MFLCRRVAFIISVEIMVYSNFWPLQHSSPTFLFTFWTEYHHNCHYWRLWDSSSVYFTVAFEVVLYNFIITHYTSCCTLHVLTVQFSFLIKNFNFKTGSENVSTSDYMSTMASVLQYFLNYSDDQIYTHLFYLLPEFGKNIETLVLISDSGFTFCKT